MKLEPEEAGKPVASTELAPGQKASMEAIVSEHLLNPEVEEYLRRPPESIDARPPSWVPDDGPEKRLRALAHERLLQLKGQEKMSYSNVLFDVYDYIQKEVRASAAAPAPVVRALLQCGLHLFCGA